MQFKNNFIVLFIIIFDTFSFPVDGAGGTMFSACLFFCACVRTRPGEGIHRQDCRRRLVVYAFKCISVMLNWSLQLSYTNSVINIIRHDLLYNKHTNVMC